MCPRAFVIYPKFLFYIILPLYFQLLFCCSDHSTKQDNTNLEKGSHQEEYDQYLGKLMVFGILRSYSVLENERIGTAISELGDELVRASDCPERKIKFFVLNCPILNAFSLPGDYIFISTLLLDSMQSKDEFVFALAHEISHICARDPLQKALRMQKSSKIVAILAEISADAASFGTVFARVDLGNNPVAQPYSSSINQIIGAVSPTLAASMVALSSAFVSEIVNKGYERSDETRADDDAIRYCAKAGYHNKQAFIDFFRRMQKIKDDQAAQKRSLKTKTLFPSSFDTLWKKALRMSSSRGVEVSWISKEHGEFSFSEQLSKDALMTLGSGKVYSHGGKLNTCVTIKPLNSRTSVEVSCGYSLNETWRSNGSYESLFLYCLENEVMGNAKYQWLGEIQ